MKKLLFAGIAFLALTGCGAEAAQPVQKPLPQAVEIEKTPDEVPQSAAQFSPQSSPKPRPTPEPTPEPTPTPEPSQEPDPTPPTATPGAPPQRADIVSGTGYSNARKGWYYNPNQNHEPPTAQREIDLSLYDSCYLGDTDRKVIYLTFDEGYENGYTGIILDILKEKDVPAAFFLTKSYIKYNPELSKRIAEEGHLAGNHSANHPSLPDVPDDQVVYEIEEVARYYNEVTGYDMAPFFRPPSGEYSERVLALTQQLGYKTVFWSFAYQDWLVDAQPGKAYTYQKVMDNTHNGCIMLLHAVSQSNTEALPDLIDSLREQGYVFESLWELP